MIMVIQLENTKDMQVRRREKTNKIPEREEDSRTKEGVLHISFIKYKYPLLTSFVSKDYCLLLWN